MSKYIIVNKDKKRNIPGQRYTITYQISDGSTNMYKVDLYCIEVEHQIKYCFIEGYNGFGIETNDDRSDFLEQLKEFQKGGSYRKKHPINYKKSALIEQEIERQEENIRVLKQELDRVKDQELDDKFTHYLDDVDNDGLNIYLNNLRAAIESNPRYRLEGIEFHIWEGHRIFIYDVELNKRVKVITIRDGKLDIRDLTKYDIK